MARRRERDEVTDSRSSHADIGGILPGSMPPTSKTIFEEGAQIKSFKIVSQGEYDRKGLLKHLCDDPAQYPNCSGTRCLRDVESDLQAQIAANQKGINLIRVLVKEWGLQTVQSVRLSMPLFRFARQAKLTSLHAVHAFHSQQRRIGGT